MTERDEQEGAEEIGTCHICGKTFPTQEEMSRHMMDAHEGEGLAAEDPRKS
jgi:hypothetical protein